MIKKDVVAIMMVVKVLLFVGLIAWTVSEGRVATAILELLVFQCSLLVDIWLAIRAQEKR